MRHFLIGSALLATLPLIGPAPATAGNPHTRTGAYFGIGVGGGNATLALVNGVEEARDGLTVNLRLGGAIGQSAALGVETAGFVRQEIYSVEGQPGDVTATYTASAAMLALTLFPGGGGLYLRGGAGLSRAKVEIADSFFSQGYEENGYAFLGAVGYGWRLTRTFSLGPHAELLHLDIGGDAIDTATVLSGSLQGTWYF